MPFGQVGVGVDGRRGEIVHGDAFGVEEVVQLDVVAVLGAAADPLAVADQQVAKFAAGVQLVEHAVGEVGPGHELELHRVAGLGLEVLGQLDKRIGRIPCGPAKRQVVGLCRRGREHRQRSSQTLSPRAVWSSSW